MSERNRTHVAISEEYSAYWGFAVPASLPTVETHQEKVYSLCKDLMGSFTDFILPTKVECTWLEPVPVQEEVPTSRTDFNSSKLDEVTISNDGGVTQEQFLETAANQPGKGKVFMEVDFHHNRVKTYLDGGDRYVDQDTGCVAYLGEDALDRDPYRDPIEIDFLPTPTPPSIPLESDYAYIIIVRILSDLWLEDNDIGERNRQYLRSFLTRLSGSLPVVETNKENQLGSDEIFDSIY